MRRHNPDVDLRELERDFAATGDKLLLRQIDSIRHRSGLFPHPATRVAIAEEQLRDVHFRCYMVLRDLRSLLPTIFEQSEGVRLLTDIINERQYLPNIDLTIWTRTLAESELIDVLRREPPSDSWMQYLVRRGLELPPDSATSGSQNLEERARIGHQIRDEMDVTSHALLEDLVRLGLINAADVLPALDGEEEETAELLLQIEEALYHRSMVYEELLMAHQGKHPSKGYQEEFGNKYWWTHIQ